MLQALKEAVTKLEKELGDVDTVDGELTELQKTLDTAKAAQADAQKAVDEKLTDQTKEKQEATEAVRDLIAAAEAIATALAK